MTSRSSFSDPSVFLAVMEKDTLYRQLKEQVAEDATLRGQLREQVGPTLGNTTLSDFVLLISKSVLIYSIVCF
jgi:hypothetical protein